MLGMTEDIHGIIYPFLLVCKYRVESSLRGCQRSSYSITFTPFLEPENSLQYSEKFATVVSTDPSISSPHHALFLKANLSPCLINQEPRHFYRTTLILSFSLYLSLPSLFPSASPTYIYLHFPFLVFMLRIIYIYVYI
jgi:hypothetical protein